jgi:hypothetical protein
MHHSPHAAATAVLRCPKFVLEDNLLVMYQMPPSSQDPRIYKSKVGFDAACTLQQIMAALDGASLPCVKQVAGHARDVLSTEASGDAQNAMLFVPGDPSFAQ